MSNVKRAIACLYAGVIAASAMEDTNKVIFDGNEKAKNCDYIKFTVGPCLWGTLIKKISIDEGKRTVLVGGMMEKL